MNDFLKMWGVIAKRIVEEKPSHILEISSRGNHYGSALKKMQTLFGIQSGTIDRIALSGASEVPDPSDYENIYGQEILEDPKKIRDYDMILILDLFEREYAEKARMLLDVLQYKITKQILIITPLNSAEGFRKYHPLVFLGLDFCFSLLECESNPLQIYSVFPKIEYKTIKLDGIPDMNQPISVNPPIYANQPINANPPICENPPINVHQQINANQPFNANSQINANPPFNANQQIKMKIAVILPHGNLTGGMKALLQQIKLLTKMGHITTVYFRSENAATGAVPKWSGFSDGDCSREVVIPASASYIDYIEDADILFLGWMYQIPEFLSLKIPVVLWEQGSSMMFGDYGIPLNSLSSERLYLHILYRMPVHILTVSNTSATALREVYNRDSFILPPGVDTEFYHPEDTLPSGADTGFHNTADKILSAANSEFPNSEDILQCSDTIKLNHPEDLLPSKANAESSISVDMPQSDAGTGLSNSTDELQDSVPVCADMEFSHPAKKSDEIPIILLVGSPGLGFKGFPFAFDVLRRAYAEGLRFKVKWASQIPINPESVDFPLELFIMPTQQRLAELYRSSDILLSTSLYESFSLPPLEAMSSGTAVIATDCGGIRAYAAHGKNCILCRQGDIKAMANALALLINDAQYRERLAASGRETACMFSAEKSSKLLEGRLLSIVYNNQKDKSRQ